MTDINTELRRIARHYRINKVCAIYQNNKTKICQILPDGEIIELELRR